MNSFNRLIDIWMNFYFVHMLEISLFILLIWLVDRYLHFDTRLRYLLWILALVKIFFPPVISLPSSIQSTVPENVILLPMISNSQIINQFSGTIHTSVLVFVLWTTWVFVLTAFMLIKNNRFRKSLSNAVPLQNSSKLKVNSLVSGLPTFISYDIQSPLLLGVWNPRLYLPNDWQNWSNLQLKSILIHEAEHLQKRDIWILVLQNLAIILFGMNPLVWVVYRRLSHLRELHCDEIAIQKTGINPIDYSKFIYTFIERQIKQPGLIFIGKSFFKNDQSLFERLNHVLNFKEAKMKTKSNWNITLAFLLAVLILPFSWRCSDNISPKTDDIGSELNIVQSVAPVSGDKAVDFQPYDSPPQPIDGFKAIQHNLRYPDIARKAGIEGRVTVQILISEEGNVLETRILKSLGDSGCDEAAVIALKSVEWQPATHKDIPVKVWVAVPVIFRLKGDVEKDTAMQHYVVHGTKYPDITVFNKVNPGSPIKFIPFDEPPQPINGFESIQKNLKYPEIARKAGIQGRVIVAALISDDGKVIDAQIIESLGKNGCDESAISALKSVKWQPAIKDGKPVKVWVSIPVVFKLK